MCPEIIYNLISCARSFLNKFNGMIYSAFVVGYRWINRGVVYEKGGGVAGTRF